MSKILKKISFIGSISCAGIVALLLILALFSVIDNFGNPLFTSIVLTALFILMINISSLLENKEQVIICLCSIALLVISSLLIIILIWSNSSNELLSKIVIPISAFSVLFNIFISNFLKFKFKYLILQIITYILLLFIAISLTINTFTDGLLIGTYLKLFIASIILVCALLIILSVLGKKYNVDYKTLSKEKILSEIAKLESQIEKLKQLL